MLFRSGLLELLSSLGLVSKIVLLILLIFSIGSWTVILYKWRFFRRQEAADLRFLKTYRRNESPLPDSRSRRVDSTETARRPRSSLKSPGAINSAGTGIR